MADQEHCEFGKTMNFFDIFLILEQLRRLIGRTYQILWSTGTEAITKNAICR